MSIAGFEDGPAPHDHSGHRDRLRTSFRKGGAEGLADYELLEMALFGALPRRDTKPLAKALIAKFGSFAEVISASRPRLLEVKGVGERVVDDLKVIQAAAIKLTQQKMVEKPALSSWSAVIDYCRSSMAYEEVEQFRVLFLDRKNMLIADEVQQEGTVDHTPVYPRQVVKRALEISASGIILVHNHPSGDPTPSRADIDMTKRIIEAAEQLGITIHDHIIVGRDGHASLRGLQLI